MGGVKLIELLTKNPVDGLHHGVEIEADDLVLVGLGANGMGADILLVLDQRFLLHEDALAKEAVEFHLYFGTVHNDDGRGGWGHLNLIGRRRRSGLDGFVGYLRLVRYLGFVRYLSGGKGKFFFMTHGLPMILLEFILGFLRGVDDRDGGGSAQVGIARVCQNKVTVITEPKPRNNGSSNDTYHHLPGAGP